MLNSPLLGWMDKCEVDVFLQSWRRANQGIAYHLEAINHVPILNELQRGEWYYWVESGPSGIADVEHCRRSR